ncbi:MAG: ABC transporter ATP-binding protein [Verrucomicrobiales bacterium]
MVEIDGITKSFTPDRKAVDAVSFTVQRGEIFGLLGHNGAGKSTLLGCTLGMVYPDAGEVRIDGVSVQRDRNRALGKVGAIFEAPAFYDYLSGWQNLKILAALSGFTDRAEMERVVAMVNLTDRIRHAVGTYSHGMRQRLALAQALLPSPEVLLLDEPTDGLDPEGIREFREFVLRLRDERGMTILFNSHLLAEVELLCDRVAIIKRGRLLYTGDGDDLRQDSERIAFAVDDWARLLEVVAPLGVRPDGDGHVRIPRGLDVAEVVAAAVGAGLKVREVRPHKETLEDLYLKVSA